MPLDTSIQFFGDAVSQEAWRWRQTLSEVHTDEKPYPETLDNFARVVLLMLQAAHDRGRELSGAPSSRTGVVRSRLALSYGNPERFSFRFEGPELEDWDGLMDTLEVEVRGRAPAPDHQIELLIGLMTAKKIRENCITSNFWTTIRAEIESEFELLGAGRAVSLYALNSFIVHVGPSALQEYAKRYPKLGLDHPSPGADEAERRTAKLYNMVESGLRAFADWCHKQVWEMPIRVDLVNGSVAYSTKGHHPLFLLSGVALGAARQLSAELLSLDAAWRPDMPGELEDIVEEVELRLRVLGYIFGICLGTLKEARDEVAQTWARVIEVGAGFTIPALAGGALLTAEITVPAALATGASLSFDWMVDVGAGSLANSADFRDLVADPTIENSIAQLLESYDDDIQRHMNRRSTQNRPHGALYEPADKALASFHQLRDRLQRALRDGCKAALLSFHS